MTEPLPDFDLYKTLGVPRGTPPNAVVAAYRGLIRRAHPDVSSDPGSAERSKRLNIARDWLTDPGRRARYDAAHPAPASARGLDRAAPSRRQPGADEVSAWRADLDVFVARCESLGPFETSRLLAQASAAARAQEVAPRAERLAARRGRAARIMAASAAAEIALGHPRLAEVLRETALGLAVADLAPLDAEALLTAWRKAILEPELRDRERRQRRARIGRAVRHVLAIGAILLAAGVMVAGLIVGVAIVAFGWVG
jgi:hypothetical protein